MLWFWHFFIFAILGATIIGDLQFEYKYLFMDNNYHNIVFLKKGRQSVFALAKNSDYNQGD
jgi:hypothetical protein